MSAAETQASHRFLAASGTGIGEAKYIIESIIFSFFFVLFLVGLNHHASKLGPVVSRKKGMIFVSDYLICPKFGGVSKKLKKKSFKANGSVTERSETFYIIEMNEIIRK